MKTNSEDKRFAGIIGKEYEKLLLAMPHYPLVQNAVARITIQNLPPAEEIRPRSILDLGCGTGLTTFALCERLSHAQILGVDKEPVMLNQYMTNMQANKSRLAQSDIRVKAAKGDALEFLKRCKSESFDAVTSAFVLHNMPTSLRVKILREIKRVLCPGGVFVNGDKIAPDDVDLHNSYMMQQFTKFVTTYNKPEDAAYCIGWFEHYAEDNRPGIKYLESEARKTLKAAGFKNVKITDRHWMEAVVSAIRS